MKIGVIGSESTGKSTLCQLLAEKLGGIYIPEYARTYVGNLQRAYAYADVEHIARQQIKELETDFSQRWVFYDTELIITKVWFEHKYHQVPRFLLEALQRNPIDAYLLCDADLPFEADPLRENKALRHYLQTWYDREIQLSQKPYAIVRGMGNERLQNALRALETLC